MNLNDKLIFLKGNNFSGRTSYFLNNLKNSNENDQSETTLIIKELPVNNITGIFSSVIEELNLHGSSTDMVLKDNIFEFLYQIGFDEHFAKNPFSLSGGEQTILVLVCNLLLQPKVLFIDTTIEQLNETWYRPFFDFINNCNTVFSKIIVADNRYKEYGIVELNEFEATKEKIEYDNNFELPKLLNDLTKNDNRQTISVKNLSFGYSKNNSIFKNINFDFEIGNIYHLKGKNGAGKSTLAKILTGVLKVPEQALFVNGKIYNSFKKPGSLCGYSFQNPDEQIFSETIENEVLPLIKNEQSEYTKRRNLYLEMFGLQNIKKKHPAEMPFVIRKRIALASTLAMERQWYIIDEPTLGQDNNFVCFFADLLHLLCHNGKGIILITHCKFLIQKLNCIEFVLKHENHGYK